MFRIFAQLTLVFILFSKGLAFAQGLSQNVQPNSLSGVANGSSATARKIDEYKACLAGFYEDSRYRSTTESSNAVEEYVNLQNTLLENIKNNKSGDRATERRRLNYTNWILERKMSECRDLADGPSKSRYIFMVGQQAFTDGQIFHNVAGSLIQDLLKSLCPRGEAKCNRQIVLKRQIQKADLLLYLKLLSPGSVKRFSFEGHGWSDGILISYKDMLVPEDWKAYSKIKILEWEADRNGAIYSNDMKFIGPALARVLDSNATVDLHTCEAGQRLAPLLRGFLSSSIKVLASTSGMEFQEGALGWSLRLDTGEEFHGKKTKMVSEKRNAFGSVAPLAFSYEELDPDALKKEKGDNGLDDMTGSILTRVSRLSSWFVWVNEPSRSPRLIVFDEKDRQAIISLFVDLQKKPHIHELDDDDLPVTNDQYRTKIQRFLSEQSGIERLYYQDLFERIDTCIRESVRLFY